MNICLHICAVWCIVICMKILYTFLDTIKYSDVERFVAVLPEKRREKIARLRFESDKLLSLAAGLLIYKAVGGCEMSFNERGKPYAVGSGAFFSVSHSGFCAAIAIDNAEVGLDVENLPESGRDYMKIARRFYHPSELSFVEKSDDPSRAFTRVWTRKEAYLKQLGIGISTDLGGFDTVSDELSQRILSYELEGYELSVCADGSINKSDIDISNIEFYDLVKGLDIQMTE